MHKIFFVEDSDECQLLVRHALAQSGVDLQVASSLTEAVQFIKKNGAQFDLAILDLVLPDGDGFDVLKELRQAGMPEDTPLFFLTSQAELDSKVLAFKLGADDYLVKPISPIELKARVEMRLRKTQSVITDLMVRGELTIEMSTLRACHVVNQKSTDLYLTTKEFKILAFLVQNENQTFSRNELVKAVWGPGLHIQDRTVDSHIYGLRKKLGPISHYIEADLGSGYRFTLQTKRQVAS